MYVVGVDDQDRVVLRLEDGSGMTMTMAMSEEDVQRLIRLLQANLENIKEQA